MKLRSRLVNDNSNLETTKNNHLFLNRSSISIIGKPKGSKSTSKSKNKLSKVEKHDSKSNYTLINENNSQVNQIKTPDLEISDDFSVVKPDSLISEQTTLVIGNQNLSVVTNNTKYRKSTIRPKRTRQKVETASCNEAQKSPSEIFLETTKNDPLFLKRSSISIIKKPKTSKSTSKSKDKLSKVEQHDSKNNYTMVNQNNSQSNQIKTPDLEISDNLTVSKPDSLILDQTTLVIGNQNLNGVPIIKKYRKSTIRLKRICQKVEPTGCNEAPKSSSEAFDNEMNKNHVKVVPALLSTILESPRPIERKMSKRRLGANHKTTSPGIRRTINFDCPKFQKRKLQSRHRKAISKKYKLPVFDDEYNEKFFSRMKFIEAELGNSP